MRRFRACRSLTACFSSETTVDDSTLTNPTTHSLRTPQRSRNRRSPPVLDPGFQPASLKSPISLVDLSTECEDSAFVGFASDALQMKGRTTPRAIRLRPSPLRASLTTTLYTTVAESRRGGRSTTEGAVARVPSPFLVVSRSGTMGHAGFEFF